MWSNLKKFIGCEDGAVTVDWVVLTAAVVALAAGAYTALKTNSDSLAGRTSTYVSERVVGE